MDSYSQPCASDCHGGWLARVLAVAPLPLPDRANVRRVGFASGLRQCLFPSGNAAPTPTCVKPLGFASKQSKLTPLGA